jgi:hypothetical protein
MASVQSSPSSAPSDFVGALLVADTRAFVDAWRELLVAGASASVEQLQELSERSKTLQSRARAAELGGLAHHLALHASCIDGSSWDRDRVEECLRNISELAWQVEQEVSLASERPTQLGVASAPSVEPSPSTERNPEASNGAAEPAATGMSAAAWPGWKKLTGSLEAKPRPPIPVEESAAEALSRVLGMAPLAEPHATPAALGGTLVSAPDPALSEPPPAVTVEPETHADPGDADDELTDRDLEIRLERVRRPPPYPVLSREIAIELPPPSEAYFHRRSRRLSRWAALAAGAGLVLIALFITTRQGLPRRPAEARRGAATTQSEALLPAPANGNRAFDGLVQQIHAYGGVESKELTELLDAEAGSISKALTGACVPGSTACKLAEYGQQLLALGPLQKAPPAAVTATGDWLRGLKLPQIGLKDEPRVKRLVEYHTADPVGREMLQGLLFRCAEQQEGLRDALTQHGLPLDLLAVPMVESACVLDA